MQERTNLAVTIDDPGLSQEGAKAAPWRVEFHWQAKRLLIAASAFSLAFVVICLGLAVWLDAPLILPEERVSRVLGVNWAVPLVMGIVSFFIISLTRHFTGSERISRAEFLGHSLTIMALIVMFVVVTYFHFHLKMWIPLINPDYWDEFYHWTDNQVRWLVDGMTALRVWLTPYWPYADYWYGLGFWGSFCIVFAYMGAMRDKYFHFAALGVLIILTAGCLSYLIAPAVGPFIYEQGVNNGQTNAQNSMYMGLQYVRELGPAWIATQGSNYFTGGLAAMPSLHIAHITLLFWYALKARSIVAPLLGILLFWTTIEVVAAKWHYLIDIPAGLVLAIAAIATSDWILKSKAPKT